MAQETAGVECYRAIAGINCCHFGRIAPDRPTGLGQRVSRARGANKINRQAHYPAHCFNCAHARQTGRL